MRLPMNGRLVCGMILPSLNSTPPDAQASLKASTPSLDHGWPF
jgi:hypothetical protein